MPQLQPFWDKAFDFYGPRSDDSGPYIGALYSPNPWDTMTIAGRRVPGIVSVSVARKRHLDIKQLPGASPILTKIGYEPTRFTVSVRVWTPKQWATLQPIMWLLEPISQKVQGNTDAALDVYHPALASLSLSQALCVSLGPITGQQEKTLAFEFIEYRKGKSSVKTIDTSNNVAAPFNAKQLADQEIQAVDGKVTTITPTHGPQQKPSQSGVTLTVTP